MANPISVERIFQTGDLKFKNQSSIIVVISLFEDPVVESPRRLPVLHFVTLIKSNSGRVARMHNMLKGFVVIISYNYNKPS